MKTAVNPAKRKPLTRTQASKMVIHAGMSHPRDRVSVVMALHTGLRASELTGLRWGDITLDGRVIRAYRGEQCRKGRVPDR